jgi:ribosomal protein S18 acetylase RimI-like enzyme
MAPIIRPMTPDDVPRATALVLRGEWGDRRQFFRFATRQPACRPLVAALDGQIVGTAVGTVNGPVGWLGAVFVDRGLRGHGLGGALTERSIADLEAAGCRSLVLVATKEGLPLYEKRGFEVETRYRTFEADGTGTAAGASGLRAFRSADLAAMADLDRAATGEDRAHLLAAFASESSARVLERDGAVRAFVVRAPWGGGATIAPDPADAAAILEARRASAPPEKRVRAGVLGSNAAGIELFARLGWTEAWSAPRLRRGESLDWHPEGIWGQFNHAIG